MKKSIFTVMTAAMFAAANLSAIPSDAADNGGSRMNVDPVETVTLSDRDWNREQLKEGENDGQEVSTTTTSPVTTTEMTTLTNTTTQTLYGPPWMLRTTTTTTMPVLLYGPPPTTTTLDRDLEENLEKMRGDVNGDEVIDTFDAIALRRAILFDEYKDQRAKLLSDINSDGKIDVTDLVLLQRFLLGAIKDFRDNNSTSMSDKTTTKEKLRTTTTTTTTKTSDAIFTTSYDPRGDIVVTLYGIKPSIDRIRDFTDNSFKDILDIVEAAETEETEQQEDK
ncbi:dockerin type I repeat-containing protein [uncultured Ruminococcus sp.]|uniref:dockerin type I repeat-containing protein n=1 Tax=uncultured Ruminococcus sp. TaxID=165186 RepID=UPI0025FE71AC|nr:dockerin type I repeat-containing protein [uncultured Ruminococcus sp.]